VTRLILIVIAVVAVVWLLRRAIAGPRRDGEPGDRPAPPAQGELVACVHCGVNLPKAEAYAARGVLPGADGSFYCNEEHWRLGPRGK
jgi:hypothetical protein